MLAPPFVSQARLPGSSDNNSDLQWTLDKYARYLGSANPVGRGKSKTQAANQKWKLHESGRDPLILTITSSHHLIITQGKEIQENHSLWSAQQWMKGISKEDSVLIIYKIQDDTRQFRVKFAGSPGLRTSVDQCRSCVAQLSKYFMFKHLGDKPPETTETQPTGLNGQVPIRKLAQVLTGELQEALPRSYQTTHLPTDPTALATLVQLCLTDTNFPAFVGAVGKALDTVTKETAE